MAEREGFEPSIGVTYTPLAGARLQPLGHLSGTQESNESPARSDPWAALTPRKPKRFRPRRPPEPDAGARHQAAPPRTTERTPDHPASKPERAPREHPAPSARATGMPTALKCEDGLHALRGIMPSAEPSRRAGGSACPSPGRLAPPLAGHAQSNTITWRAASPLRMRSNASLTSSSGMRAEIISSRRSRPSR